MLKFMRRSPHARSFNLDERLFIANFVEVRQVRFHPGSSKNSHILALTSDNMLRLYYVDNQTAYTAGVFAVGECPKGMFPGTKTTISAVFGEVGVDFDFGCPEIDEESDVDVTPKKDLTSGPVGPLIKLNTLERQKRCEEVKEPSLVWPVYVLRGDGSIYTINVPVAAKERSTPPVLRGPIPKNFMTEGIGEDACALICLNSNPQMFCVANSNGTIYHSILLPIEKNEYDTFVAKCNQIPNKELLCFESIELELGLSTSGDDSKYSCPIFLHTDDSCKAGRYFATHSAGVHSVTITCLKDLHTFVNNPIDENISLDKVFVQESKPEYLVCTKTASSEHVNPVVGFSLYYEPTSLICLLANGDLVTLAILAAAVLPPIEELDISRHDTEVTSPLKSILKEPFDQVIAKILKSSSGQPILKLSDGGDHSQKECYELLQRASQVFREEYFENNIRAREEIEKRVKALKMILNFQLKSLGKLNNDKQDVQEKAESIAEKYEELKDRQDDLMKRCEKLLILVSQKKSEPSDAERAFIAALAEYKAKVETYKKAIEKLKMKVAYQKIQMENWNAEAKKKVNQLGERHHETITTNLKEMSQKIAAMVKEVREYKDRLNLK